MRKPDDGEDDDEDAAAGTLLLRSEAVVTPSIGTETLPMMVNLSL